MGCADERQHVVLAHRVHRNAARQDQLVVVLIVGEGGEVERAWAEHLGVGLRHAPRRVGQRLVLGADAQRDEKVRGGALGG
jgi:hypothetical protein